jgi:metal-responsive CopG/Arc/MetJ family transcriptional regulator
MISEEEWKTISLRVPTDILTSVDNRVKKRAALTRTAWILEAIQQKLKAEDKHDTED